MAEQMPCDQGAQGSDEVVRRLGNLIRMLRDNIRELGLNEAVEKAAEAIPDARDRLGYIADMTERAAERSLNAIDRAQPLQERMAEQARDLHQRWQQWFDDPVELAQARMLVADTRSYLAEVPSMTRDTNKELLEITLAQDFQDLTGQVIKRMMEVIRFMEFELLSLLVDTVPEEEQRGRLQLRSDELRATGDQQSSLLNGPQVRDGDDVVSGQDQVDALLADMGF
jgi:chemotaxis protein CheZ